METKSRVKNIVRDWNSGKFCITFEIDDEITEEIVASLAGDLRLTAKKWRDKRSLDANAYYYVLCGKIAEKLFCTKREISNQMIADYGQFMYMDDDQTRIQKVEIKKGIDWTKIESLHLKPSSEFKVHGDDVYQVYYVMRGSHTYDTAEMSVLINGVVQEAKNLNIETITPNEIRRMIAAWKNQNGERV